MTELALYGGPPVLTGPYPSAPHIDDLEHRAARRVLESGVLSGFIASPGEPFLGGPEVRALEFEWKRLGHYQHVVSVNSATAALHAGLVAMDLPAGTEVIVPPFTMSATIAAVRMAGLVPRFADLDPRLFTLTATTVEPVLNERTGGMVIVHLFGQMAPMKPLLDLADRHGLKVLEDNAQSPGATQDGAWPGHGTLGAVFSFNQHKTITCGEGGLLATDLPAVAMTTQLIRNHAEAVIHAFPEMDARDVVGWNYRLTELSAAVATAQTAKLQFLNDRRVALAERLSQRVEHIPGLEPPFVHPGNGHVYFTYAIRFDEKVWGFARDDLVLALRAEGVPCSAGYVNPLYRLPMFDPESSELDPAAFPVCERLAGEELLLLPVVGWPATEADVDRVIEALEKCWERHHKIRQAA